MKPTKKKRNRTRIALPNGASCTEPRVNPENWNTARASLKTDWYVKFNFYATDGTMRSVTRKNMNDYTTLTDRQDATRGVIQVLKDDLLGGWNPITDKYPRAIPESEVVEQPVVPELSLARALAFAVLKRYKYRPRKTVVAGSNFDRVLAEVRTYVRGFLAVAKTLNLHYKPIRTIRRRDVLEVLEVLSNERKWGYAGWNNAKAYLSALWKTMIVYELTENNPIDDIPKRTPSPKKPVLLTVKQRGQIKSHLQKEAPEFLRAVMIFFESGCREEEMCRIQGKDVDLKGQEFTVEVRKGKGPWRPVTKAITDSALPFWQEAMEECKPDEYVFSNNFRPGKYQNGGEKFNRWWLVHVKQELGINANMYALKHLHTTEIASQNEQMAADFNSHADTRMNEKHYDQLSEKRKLEARKRQNLKF